jgi:glycosyltransferase involved in cell wall biosynthesis
MSKIALITSSPMTVKAFLLPFINELIKDNEVHVIANWTNVEEERLLPDGVIVHCLNLERSPNPLKDLGSLVKLIQLLKKGKYDITHTFTPKAGLIGQLASYISRVKNRYHTFTGQVWATKTGWVRMILKRLDKLTGSLTTYALVDSPSQQQFLLDNNVIRPGKSTVLGLGSISGVNLRKFKFSDEKRLTLRAKLGLDEDDFVILYAGRLKVDKGIPELISAFDMISTNKKCYLVVVGADEDNLLPLLKSRSNVLFCGFTDDITSYFSMADLLCLPSHREGFGNVIIEAAACKLPALASNIYGLSDAIENKKSGLLHRVNDPYDIVENLKKLINDKALLLTLGEGAFIRVSTYFTEEHIVEEFIKFYKHNNV